jgi:small nuclear ribonucleoprotein (snRNP)-like protein
MFKEFMETLGSRAEKTPKKPVRINTLGGHSFEGTIEEKTRGLVVLRRIGEGYAYPTVTIRGDTICAIEEKVD